MHLNLKYLSNKEDDNNTHNRYVRYVLTLMLLLPADHSILLADIDFNIIHRLEVSPTPKF